MTRQQLLGPFSQMITMDHLSPTGPLKDDELEVVEGGGLLLEGVHIKQVLSKDQFQQLREKARSDFLPMTISPVRESTVLLPGFIDSHTHICYTGSRTEEYARRLAGETYQQIAEGGGGILSTVKHTREASGDALVQLLADRAKEHLLRGVTTCEVKSGYGLDVRSELKMLRAIGMVKELEGIYPTLVPTCLAAHVLPPEFSSHEEYLEYVLEEILPRVRAGVLAERVDIFIDEGAFAPEMGRKFLTKAKAMGFSLVVHADQFAVGGSLVAAEVGAMSADHLEQSTEREMRALLEKGVVAIALPGSSLGLGGPFAPVRKMLDMGLSVVIASDWNPGSAPMGDLLTQAALLGADQRLSMAETLAGITYRAARALGLEDRGTIKPGFVADLVGFPCESFKEILYRQGAIHPSLVVCRGHRVM